MGGYSDEYHVSLKSGALIYESLAAAGYQPYKVIILHEKWYAELEDGKQLTINKEDFSAGSGADRLTFDVCFNTIHGRPGENGELQAYWDVIGQRYTGCGFYQSALTFNKKDTLAVLAKYGIPSAKSIYLGKSDVVDEDKIINNIGLPLFVKPNQSGSSLGISKVKEKSELRTAIELAFREDDEVLIEKFVSGTEVSVGVLDLDDVPTVLGITEIVSKNEFFDYEAKYQGASEEITPARLPEDIRKKVEAVALAAYQSLGMRGFSRSEFIIEDGVPYMLEMNTNPGFSPASILPQQAKIYGITIPDLCSKEVQKALAKN